jgi:predicted nucleic acid-binding protein
MSNVYLDASALTKLIVEEPETAALREVIRGHWLLSSRVAVVEVTKEVTRHDPDAEPIAFFLHVTFLELDAELATAAGATGGPDLRALDAIHVATALILRSEIESFITYDARQSEAARAAGLQVIAPGLG